MNCKDDDMAATVGFKKLREQHSKNQSADLDAAFQAGADAARREDAGIATKKAETLRKAAHVVQQATEDALRMAELAILTADDIAAATLARVGKPVDVKE